MYRYVLLFRFGHIPQHLVRYIIEITYGTFLFMVIMRNCAVETVSCYEHHFVRLLYRFSPIREYTNLLHSIFIKSLCCCISYCCIAK